VWLLPRQRSETVGVEGAHAAAAGFAHFQGFSKKTAFFEFFFHPASSALRAVRVGVFRRRLRDPAVFASSNAKEGRI
jgi:hypothetical protein